MSAFDLAPLPLDRPPLHPPVRSAPPALVEARVLAHTPLVERVVHETMRRVPSHVDRDDLTSAGLTALVQAARAYDDGRGVPFDRYAAARVRGAVLDELRSADWASRSVRRRARDLDEARTRLAAGSEHPPTTADVARAAGLTEQEVQAHGDDVARAQVLSLHATATPLDELLATRAPSPEALLEHKERLTYLVEAVAELPDRLRTVVVDYFFAERRMTDIAADLGVTDSRISQMRAEALALLREALDHALGTGPAAERGGGRADRRRAAYVAAVAARHADGLRPQRPGGPLRAAG